MPLVGGARVRVLALEVFVVVLPLSRFLFGLRLDPKEAPNCLNREFIRTTSSVSDPVQEDVAVAGKVVDEDRAVEWRDGGQSAVRQWMRVPQSSPSRRVLLGFQCWTGGRRGQWRVESQGRSLAFSWAVLSGLVDLVVGLSRGESNSRRLEEDGERLRCLYSTGFNRTDRPRKRRRSSTRSAYSSTEYKLQNVLHCSPTWYPFHSPILDPS